MILALTVLFAFLYSHAWAVFAVTRASDKPKGGLVEHDCIDNLIEIVPVIGVYSCKVCGSDFSKSDGGYMRMNGRKHALKSTYFSDGGASA